MGFAIIFLKYCSIFSRERCSLFTSSWCANVCIQIKTLNQPALVDLSWNGRDSSPQLANPKPSNFGLDNHFNAEIGKSEPLMVLGPGQDMFNHSIEAVGCLVDGKAMGDEGLELWVLPVITMMIYDSVGLCVSFFLKGGDKSSRWKWGMLTRRLRSCRFYDWLLWVYRSIRIISYYFIILFHTIPYYFILFHMISYWYSPTYPFI